MHKLHEICKKVASSSGSLSTLERLWEAKKISLSRRVFRADFLSYRPAPATWYLQVSKTEHPAKHHSENAHVAMRWISTEKTMPGLSLSCKLLRPVPLIVADFEGVMPLNAASCAYFLRTLQPLMLNSWRASASADRVWCQCKVLQRFSKTCLTFKVLCKAFHWCNSDHCIPEISAISVLRWARNPGLPPLNVHFL